MFEIRLDNDWITCRGDFREALIEVIDWLLRDKQLTLSDIYRRYRSYSDEELMVGEILTLEDEDLIEEIAELAPDKFLDIRVNIRLDQKIRATTQLLD